MTSSVVKPLTKETIATHLKADALFFSTLNQPYGSWLHFDSDPPTQAEVTDWLRQEQDIHIYCYPRQEGWSFGIESNIKSKTPSLYNHDRVYSSCEEACEDAILFVFQNNHFIN